MDYGKKAENLRKKGGELTEKEKRRRTYGKKAENLRKKKGGELTEKSYGNRRGRQGYPLANGLSRGREPRHDAPVTIFSWAAQLSMSTHEREAAQDGAVDTGRQAPWGNRGGCEVARSALLVR